MIENKNKLASSSDTTYSTPLLSSNFTVHSTVTSNNDVLSALLEPYLSMYKVIIFSSRYLL